MQFIAGDFYNHSFHIQLVINLGYEFGTGRHWRHIWLAKRFFASLNESLSRHFIPELDYKCDLTLALVMKVTYASVK
jgi:hypothetical protein